MGRNIINTMEKVIAYILSSVAACGLFMSSLAATVSMDIALAQVRAHETGYPSVPAGAVMPHHLLVEKDMDELYARLAALHDYRRIVIISPNHFNRGIHSIETTDAANDKFTDVKIDSEANAALVSGGIAYNSPVDYYLEHGITNHLSFIRKYFPDARIVPIIIKEGTTEPRLDSLAHTLAEIYDKDTLIVASVDFTHYATESDALKNDARTEKFFSDWGGGTFKSDLFAYINTIRQNVDPSVPDSCAFDSTGTLYVTLRVMELTGNRGFSFEKRTSSAAILGVTDPALNTSHIFGVFGK